jgi:hypothetical protein
MEQRKKKGRLGFVQGSLYYTAEHATPHHRARAGRQREGEKEHASSLSSMRGEGDEDEAPSFVYIFLNRYSGLVGGLLVGCAWAVLVVFMLGQLLGCCALVRSR